MTRELTVLRDTAVAVRLPDDRRAIISAMIHLKAGEPERARAALDALPAEPATIRSDLGLKTLPYRRGANRKEADE